MAEESKSSASILMKSVVFGIIFAGLHALLGYVTVHTSPKEIQAVERRVQMLDSLIDEGNKGGDKEEITKRKKVQNDEVGPQIAKAKLDELYLQHLVKHYGDEKGKDLAREVKNENYNQFTEENQKKLEEIDTAGIYKIYLTLGSLKTKLAAKEELEQVSEETKESTLHSAAKAFLEETKERPYKPIVPDETNTWWGVALAFALGFLTAAGYLYSAQLYTKILVGMFAGVFFGYLFGPIVAMAISPIGKIFINMIKMVVVPLVFASLVLGVVSLGDISKVGRIGGKTIAYYLVTTSFAIAIGLVLANIIRPGDYISEAEKQKFQQEYSKQAKEKSEKPKETADLLVDIVPTNPINSMATGNMLQVIFFALFFGLVLATVAVEKKEIIEKGLDGLNDAMITMVIWVMEVAPIGVFALMAVTIAQAGISILKALAVYAIVVLIGLGLHIILIYGSAVWIFAKMNPIQYLRRVRAPQLIAFSTSSSAATLPVSMRCAEEKLGVEKEVSSFVLPLGATINMDGTALYQGVAAVFIAQVYGMDLGVSEQLTILLTATLASIGTAAVPGAGIVILAMVLESIGVPVVGIALIMGVDRILDMCRTTVNVTGDLSATLFIHSTESRRKEKMGDTGSEEKSDSNG